MLDLRFIRENPDLVKEALVKLNTMAPIDEILSLDEQRRGLLSEVETLKARRNTVSKEIGKMKDGDRRQALIEEMREVGERIKGLDDQVRQVEEQLNDAMLQVPNMPHESVPVGRDESENVVVRTWGQPEEFDFEPLPHWDLGPTLDIIDFERGVKLSGTRFYVLKGTGARLQRALITWMLDLHINEHGYTEIYPPFITLLVTPRGRFSPTESGGHRCPPLKGSHDLDGKPRVNYTFNERIETLGLKVWFCPLSSGFC